MSAPIPPANTVGVIAQRLGAPVHRVRYVIDTRHIRPVAIAGAARVFSDADVQHIASELRRIAEEKEGGRDEW
jgi:hypothetical protein